MEKDLQELFCMYILNDIKDNISKNNVVLENKDMIDNIMISIIKDLYGNVNGKNFTTSFVESGLNIQVIDYLTLCYVALYNDNMQLLRFLLENKFDFKRNVKLHNGINLFVLDKKLSELFSYQDYLIYLNEDIDKLYKFYTSLNEDKDNNRYKLERFIASFEGNSNIIVEKFKKSCQVSLKVNVSELFDQKTISSFDNIQKAILNEYFTNPYLFKNDKLIIDIVKNYDKYIGFCDKSYIMDTIQNIMNNIEQELELLTIIYRVYGSKELLNFSKEKIKVLKFVYGRYDFDSEVLIGKEKKILKKIEKLFEKKPDYSYAFKPIVYDTLSNRQILNLSEKGYNEINENTIHQTFSLYNPEKCKHIRMNIKYLYCKDRCNTFVKKLTKNKK